MPDRPSSYSEQLEEALAHVLAREARIVVPAPVGLHRRRPGAHFHPTPEFFYQLGGASKFECPSAQFVLRTGELCIMPAGVPHAETPQNLGSPYSLLVLMRMSNGFFALRGGTDSAGRIQSLDVQGFEHGGRAFQCLELAAASHSIRRSLRRQYIEGLTTAFLSTMISEIRSPTSSHDRNVSPLVLEAERTVRIEISRSDLTVQSVANRIGCSPDHLTRLFRAEHGMSLGVWIAKERVQMAGDLLRHPEHNIAEVAWTCGFSSASYFIRVFKAHTGTTPKAWRTSEERMRTENPRQLAEMCLFGAHLRKLQPKRQDPREHGRLARVGVGLAAKASLQTGETPVLPAICNFRARLF
jgi:AraC-like DNA-binding protein